jgi:hypothetical protein
VEKAQIYSRSNGTILAVRCGREHATTLIGAEPWVHLDCLLEKLSENGTVFRRSFWGSKSMRVKVDDAERTVEINGRKFTFEFFDHLVNPDEGWLYSFQTVDGAVTMIKVMRIPDEAKTLVH